MKKIGFCCVFVFVATLSYAADAIVARVNDAPITSRQLEEAVDRLIPRATFHGNVTEGQRKEFRDKALQDLIDQELQYQDGLAQGMKPDKKRVKDRMEGIRDKFKSKKDYKAALEQAGVTEDELRKLVEKDELRRAAIVKMTEDPAQMTDAALKDYYDQNTSKFRQPDSVKLRLISTKDEKKAKDILMQLKSGADFGDLAARLSEDNFRIKGGDIGYVHKGRILPELEDSAFNKLKVGEISGLIRAEETWFIITVEDRKPARQLSFEEVKEKLKKELESKRSADLKEKWIAGLREKAKIEVLLNTQ